MIKGTVNGILEAVITVVVSGTAERSSRVDALIDTGYGGDIMLPTDVVRDLGLVRVGGTRLVLANGKEESFRTYMATVDWSGNKRGVAVHATSAAALVGMRLLEGHSLQIDVHQGGRVLIETPAAYQRRLIAAADARRAAPSVDDTTMADSMVRTTCMARRASPRRARPAPHVIPRVYDDLMNIKRCPAGFASIGRDRCHTPSLGWSHAT